MNFNQSCPPRARQQWFREFRAKVETFLRVAATHVWQPHWSHDDPLPIRLGRAGLDTPTVAWILWWIDAYDKMERGELLDRSREPPTPERFRHHGPFSPECLEARNDKRSGRQKRGRLDRSLFDLAFWTL